MRDLLTMYDLARDKAFCELTEETFAECLRIRNKIVRLLEQLTQEQIWQVEDALCELEQ